MNFRNIIRQAKAANASDDQIAFIKRLASLDPSAEREVLVGGRLGKWLTALEVGHRPDSFWTAVVEQTERSRLFTNNPTA